MDVYLVGGAVRDALLGRKVTEKDWVVVGATPAQMLAKGYTQVGKDFPVFLHPKTKDEYALARTERKAGKGYTGFECYAASDVTLEEDLIRRDLTINAMAQAKDGTIVDPYHGQQDLTARVLRHVSPAFSEDPLRVFRVARFAARYAYLGFTVCEDTFTLMRSMAQSGELNHLTAERVWKETERSLSESRPDVFFSVLANCDALPCWFAELTPHLDKLTTLLHTMAEDNADILVRWAVTGALLQPDEVDALCKRVKCPNKYTELAELVCRFGNVLSCEQPLETYQQIIRQCDVWRKPERFSQLLSVCLYLTDDRSRQQALTQQLEAGINAAMSLQAKTFVEQGLRGPAIGEAMSAERDRIIAAHLS